MGSICHKNNINPVDQKLKDTTASKKRVTLQTGEEIKLIENFIVKGNLGKGSFGRVYLVECKEDNKLYAMKVLNKNKVKESDCVENSKVERIILSTLSFPFIVDLFWSFQTSSRLFLVTEYINGGDLFHLILKQGKFSHSQIKLYAAELVLSLEYLHSNNCIYRDLKPENILVNHDGHMKLIDFGLSKMFLDPKNLKNRAESICGTAEYMAPEVIIQENYDSTVDWFSLGAILYFFYTGNIAFKCKKDPFNVQIKKQKLYFNMEIFNSETEDFITKLVAFFPQSRLGYKGISEIKDHPYFDGLDFDKVLKKNYTPEYIPELIRYDDDYNNNEEFFKETYKESSMKDEIKTYEGFTYVRENDVN